MLRKVFDFRGRELRVAVLLFVLFFLIIAVFQTNMFVQRLAKGISILAALGLAALGFGMRFVSVATITTLVLLGRCGLYAWRRFYRISREKDRDRYAA